MVHFTPKRAKLIILLSQLAPELRYCEWLATRLQCNYKHLAGDIRSMVLSGWLYSERGQMFKRRKYLTINQVGLVDAAKRFLEETGTKTGNKLA